VSLGTTDGTLNSCKRGLDGFIFVIFTDPLDTLDGPQFRAYAMYIHRREFYFGYFKTWDQFHQRLQAAFVLADT